METCLHVPWHYIEPSLPYVDLFLADLKHVDGEVFKQWTDGSAKRILDNLKRLAVAGKKITIRVPLIQGFNADEASITAITNFAADELGVDDIHFLPYHTLGMNKYTLLGQPTLPLTNRWITLPCWTSRSNTPARKGLTATLRG